MTKSLNYLVFTCVFIGLISGLSAQATIRDPNSVLCDVLLEVGSGCVNTGTYSNSSNSNTVGGSSNLANLNNSTANSGTVTDPVVTRRSSSNSGSIFSIFSSRKNTDTLVKVNDRNEVYRIVNGKKHLIPTDEIFNSYGYTQEQIQDISFWDLAKYPRVRLVNVKGDTKRIYYLTEGGMVRFIPDQKILNSYGNRIEDVVTISDKEFNFYRRDHFVYLENPLNRDIYQLANGTKRYLTPMAVRRMGLRDIDVAPVNQIELSYYKTASPIVN